MAGVLLIGMMAVGWIAAGSTLGDNDETEQTAMIGIAQNMLKDKLYIGAIAKYKEALNTYSTKNNLGYEGELLNIYKEAGMMEEYYALINKRIEAKTAALEEYIDLAQYYVASNSVKKAMPVLKQGMKLFTDDRLVSLYESISYERSVVGTLWTEVRMPGSDWYIPAYDGEHWGYIGPKGKTAMLFQYEEVTCFSQNFAVVKLDGVYTRIDKKGYWHAVDKTGLDQVTAFCKGKLVGVKGGQYAIYGNTFNVVSKEVYEGAYLNENGLIVVKKGGKWAILDEKLEAVTDYIFTDVAVNSRGQVFSGNYAVVADEKGYYIINQKGEPCFETRFADAKGYEQGLIAVADATGKWGFADEKGNLVVECQYEDAGSFSNRLGAVKYAGKWGYISRYNTMVIDAKYEQAYPFLGGKALAADDLGRYQIITLKHYSLF